MFFLLDSFEIGGTETQAVELARRLDPARYRVTLGCLRASGPLRQRLSTSAVEIREFHPRGGINSIGGLYQLLRLAEFLRRGRFDVVHTHDLWSNLLGVPAAYLARVPVIISSRRDLSHGDWYTPRRRRMLSRIQRRCGAVLVNSAAVRDDLLANDSFSAEQVRIIRNGVDVERFQESGEESRILPQFGNGKVIVLVGNMHSDVKGQSLLIEAAPEVIARFPNTRFVLVGDGALRPQLESRVKALGVSQNIIFAGRRGDVPEVLAASDMAVLPSLAEGLPNAVLEYMAAGLPTIATSVGGNIEIVEDGRTGLLIPPRDARALAGAILRLLGNPGFAANLGRAGQDHVRANFSFESLTNQTTELYAELLQRRGAMRQNGRKHA